MTEDRDSLVCPIRELLLDQEDAESCFMLQQQAALAILGNSDALLVMVLANFQHNPQEVLD